MAIGKITDSVTGKERYISFMPSEQAARGLDDPAKLEEIERKAVDFLNQRKPSLTELLEEAEANRAAHQKPSNS